MRPLSQRRKPLAYARVLYSAASPETGVYLQPYLFGQRLFSMATRLEYIQGINKLYLAFNIRDQINTEE